MDIDDVVEIKSKLYSKGELGNKSGEFEPKAVDYFNASDHCRPCRQSYMTRC
jgi:hypothetical protein